MSQPFICKWVSGGSNGPNIAFESPDGTIHGHIYILAGALRLDEEKLAKALAEAFAEE